MKIWKGKKPKGKETRKKEGLNISKATNGLKLMANWSLTDH